MNLVCHDGVSLSSKELNQLAQLQSARFEQRSNAFRIILKRKLRGDLELVFGRCFITCRVVDGNAIALPSRPLEQTRRTLLVNSLASAIRKKARRELIRRLKRGEFSGV